MHLKQKGYCFGVTVIYTITTITLPPVGWCEPTTYSSKPSSHLALDNDRNRALTTRGLPHPVNRGGRQRLHLDPRQGGESRSVPYFHYLENGDGTQTKTFEGRPTLTFKPRMADRSVKTRDEPKQTEEGWMYASPNPLTEACSNGEIKPVIHGKFYITGELAANIPNVDYQSDSAVSGQERSRGQRLSSSEIWQRLQPVVECADNTMTLTVGRRRAAQLLLDRGNESSVPLSQLPPQCGYKVQTTWKDLSLMAQYDACHVTQEDDSYVLPLLWRGSPVKMSCPVFQIQSQAMDSPSPPSLCCSTHGMTIVVRGLAATEVLRVNVRGEWTPLVVLAEQCGYTLDRHGAEIVIAAPFISCGITVKDGKYTLSLQIGEKTFTLSCPVPPPELPLTHQPLVNSPHHLTSRPTEQMPESLEPFPWAPPFYLAPPYYPHPTYHNKYHSPEGHDAFNPPTTSPLTLGPQPLSPVDPQPYYQDYYSQQIPVRESYEHFSVHSFQSSTGDIEDSSQVYPDLQQKQETPLLGLPEKHSATYPPSSDTDFPIQVEAPLLPPPSHAFNQYYHYYHHPKIPLPDPPRDPDPGPEVLSLTNPHNPGSSVLFPSIQQSEAFSRFNSDEFLQPLPEAASHPYALPTSAPYKPYPPQPYPYHYFNYFPYIAMGETKRLAPPNPDTTAKTNLSDYQSTKSSILVDLLPHSSEVHDEYNLNPYTEQPKPEKMTHFKRNSPKWLKHQLLSDDVGVKAELEPPGQAAAVPPEQPTFPTLSPNHNIPPYLYYYHPLYHYYQMYYGPQSLHSAGNPVSLTSSKEALDPLLKASSPPQHASYRKPQNTSPLPTKPLDDAHHEPLHPYYYFYHLRYQPRVSVDNQDVPPAGSMNSKSESPLPIHAAKEEYPSMAQLGPFHSLHPHDIAEQRPYDPFWHPHGEETDERLDNEMKDCTEGQHLIFAVPDSVEPTAAPTAHLAEVSNVSCTLQRLTSDPDVYIVLLDGCGVNKHASHTSTMFGQTVVHLSEVHGIYSPQEDHSSVHENSPVRLMVECSSSLGSPGEMRLHVMDKPPLPPVQSTPATVTVQLRIATDESFTSFQPEAHLPLGLIRGRPVYVEVSLLDPLEPSLVLLVHSCLAYTQDPYTSWMLVYDGCSSRGQSQLLPSPHSDHTRRIIISSFLSLPSGSPTNVATGGCSHLEDPEIFFLCLTEVCSAANGDCTVGCINSLNSDV